MRHRALHSEYELTVLLSLLASIRPETVLEIGTNQGGLIWALAQFPSMRRVISVDVEEHEHAKETSQSLGLPVALVTGNSMDMETYATVVEALGDHQPQVVVIDGGHDLVTAASDFGMYGALTEPGGIIVVHDTQGYPGHPEIQVPVAWQDIRARYRTTEIIDRPGGPCGTGIVWT
jgi:cephalosporin hydroxylase